MERRPLLALLALGLLQPWTALAAAWNKDAFGAKSVADALKSLGAGSTAPSKDLAIEAPQIAENGMVVPIEVTSNIPGTRAISVIIEKNPFPLAGRFEFADGALPFVKVNVKMA
jgi:sulfur-oxidizing protein SoxY